MTPEATTPATGRWSERRWFGTEWRLFVVVFIPFFALYVATANKDLPYHIDAITNVYSAWTIGTTGSPILEEHAGLTEPGYRATYGWVIESPRGPVSQYPPGTALLAAPLYTLFAPEAADVRLVAENETTADPITVPVPSLVTAAVVASAAAAGSVALLGLVLNQLGMGRTAQLAGVVTIGLGTGLWSVAADALWQHGPNTFWLMLGVWLAVRHRWLGSGLAFGVLALTRLPVILVGIAFGIDLLVQRRFREAARLAIGTVPGLSALVAYNWWVFGEPSLTGGYSDAFAAKVLDADATGYAANIVSALLDSQHGLVVWSPFIAIAILGIPLVRRVDRWVWTAAIGGSAYFLLQLKANRASGGDGFSYYRYPIEWVVAAGPLLIVAISVLWTRGTTARFAILIAAGFAVVAHAAAAV